MKFVSVKKILTTTIFSFIVVLPTVVSAAERAFENPLTGKSQPISLASAVGLIVRGILGVSGILAMIFIIIGGIRIIAAHGNEEQFKKGTQTLLWSVVGLAVAFVGYVLVGAVVQRASLFFAQ